MSWSSFELKCMHIWFNFLFLIHLASQMFTNLQLIFFLYPISIKKNQKPEEKRRNAIMYDLLFVNSCHPLSACISTLDNKCKNMSNNERALVKEKINPIERLVLNALPFSKQICLCYSCASDGILFILTRHNMYWDYDVAII